jgi:hypothetical protein
MILVVMLHTMGPKSVVVNVYRDGSTMPMLDRIELPASVFPYEPTIGDQFQLVVASDNEIAKS